MERGKRQVLLGNALIEKRLDIGFRINAATTRNVIHARSKARPIVELLHRNAQKACDLIDKCTGASRARTVHAHVAYRRTTRMLALREENHLRILAAQLNSRSGRGEQLPYRNGVCHYLLNVKNSQGLRHGSRA